MSLFLASDIPFERASDALSNAVSNAKNRLISKKLRGENSFSELGARSGGGGVTSG